MVVVQLMGGLGNQMFQYAFGRSLAYRRSDELFLDTATLPALKPARGYELDVFNITGRLTSPAEITAKGAKVVWVASEFDFRFSGGVIEECIHHEFICIAGWWQSEKYFNGISSIINQEFTRKYPPESGSVIELMDLIGQVEAVCVHVRRTDYLDSADSKGFLGLDYYERAVKQIKQMITRPHFFVFSDDIEWCREHLDLDAPFTLVHPRSDGEARPSDDFYLMSLCKHFIVANSTYSWWAGWLGKREGKIVIAPKAWFRGERDSGTSDGATLSSVDLIPEDWIRM